MRQLAKNKSLFKSSAKCSQWFECFESTACTHKHTTWQQRICSTFQGSIKVTNTACVAWQIVPSLCCRACAGVDEGFPHHQRGSRCRFLRHYRILHVTFAQFCLLLFEEPRFRGDLSVHSVDNAIRGVFVVPRSLFKHEESSELLY